MTNDNGSTADYTQSRFWQTTAIAFDVAGVADMKARYSSKVFSPSAVRVEMSRNATKPSWRVDHVRVTGRTRLKSGKLSELVSGEVSWYRVSDDMPAWLRPIVADAIAAAERSTAGGAE
jgi:hypothetical protein